ncbi:apovitellenin-1-like [Engystomops pustulosus]|uniref:apovitellenin-1-like n=1 Tax=Engystomops pustulosus TaxID=76066 RepID=UPI003AFA5F5A
MRLQVIAIICCFLLLLSYGAEGKAVSKRHVRRDWLIIPDTVAFYIYSAVNNVSPEAGQKLMDAFGNPVIQEIRSLLIAKTSELSRQTEELYQKVFEFFQGKE